MSTDSAQARASQGRKYWRNTSEVSSHATGGEKPQAAGCVWQRAR